MQARQFPFSARDTWDTKNITLLKLEEWIKRQNDFRGKGIILNVVIAYARQNLMRATIDWKYIIKPVSSDRFEICEMIFNSVELSDAAFVLSVQQALNKVTQKNSQLRDSVLPLLKIVFSAPLLSSTQEVKQACVSSTDIIVSALKKEEIKDVSPVLVQPDSENEAITYVNHLLTSFKKELSELSTSDKHLVLTTAQISMLTSCSLSVLLDESFFFVLLLSSLTTAATFLGYVAFSTERAAAMQKEQSDLAKLYDYYVYLTKNGSVGTHDPIALEILTVIAPYLSTQDILHWRKLPEDLSYAPNRAIVEENASKPFIHIMAKAPHYLRLIRDKTPSIKVEEGKFIVSNKSTVFSPVLGDDRQEWVTLTHVSVGTRFFKAVSSALYSLAPVKRIPISTDEYPAGIPLPPKL